MEEQKKKEQKNSPATDATHNGLGIKKLRLGQNPEYRASESLWPVFTRKHAECAVKLREFSVEVLVCP